MAFPLITIPLVARKRTSIRRFEERRRIHNRQESSTEISCSGGLSASGRL